jgi:cell wall-associated NlpC family hydrolase
MIKNQYICPLSVAPLRKEPSDRSEMVSQVLFGETMHVLESNEKWHLVRLEHDGYEGWIDKKQVISVEADLKPPQVLRDIHAKVSVNGRYLHLPAGALLAESAKPLESATKTIESYAMMFLETPYLWGGRTFMGIDCSGFTQIVFRLVGKQLPRDAYQQAEIGEHISFVEEAETGDLAFFDNAEGRITHVGIVLKEQDGKTNIIHASGKVRIDALDHSGIYNDEMKSYSHKLRLIKRI